MHRQLLTQKRLVVADEYTAACVFAYSVQVSQRAVGDRTFESIQSANSLNGIQQYLSVS